MKRKIIIAILGLSFGFTASTVAVGHASAQEAGVKSTTVTLAIQGMATTSCPVLVKTAVGKMTGVSKVDASLEKKTATIVFDSSATSAAEIQRVIKDQVGFDTEIVQES